MRESKIRLISAGFNSGRRRVLRLSLLGFAACSAPIFGWSLADEVPDRSDVWLMELVSNNAGAARLGADYLKQFPNEAEPKVLSRLVGRALSKASFSPQSFTSFKSAIASTIRNEYRADRIVRVDGWLLSSTEARLYALSSLRITG